MIYLIRRKKLGRTSCREISRLSATGIKVFRNDVDLPPGELVFRWGCTSNVPSDKIVNNADAIHLVSDKTAFRRLLDTHDLCPITYFENGWINGIPFPCIVRPRNHAQGRKLYVCRTNVDLKQAIEKCGPGWYASEIIDKVAEYRVFVVSGRATCVASKTPANPQAIAWNVARGGRFDNVQWKNWPLKVVKTAIEAFKLSGLDFGGMDIMVDAQGETYVLEINAAPSLTSPYRQRCMARAFDYIVRNGKAMIPLIEEKGGYRKFIHPAVCAEAL